MPQICTRMSDYLYQELELKAQELDTEKSALVRDFIRMGLSNLQTNHAIYSDLIELQKQTISFAIRSHCMAENVIADYVDKGPELIVKSHSKAEELVNNLLKNLSKPLLEPIELLEFKAGLQADN